MRTKKNGFLLFLCSLVPGAGEMYLGFMKMGATTMTLFFGICAIAGFFNLEVFLFILPIIWCYSFFRVHNLKGLDDAAFAAVVDEPAFELGEIKGLKTNHLAMKVIAIALIVIGCKLILDEAWSYIANYISSDLAWAFANFFRYDFLRIVIAIAIIFIGIRMIMGKKKEVEEEN